MPQGWWIWSSAATCRTFSIPGLLRVARGQFFEHSILGHRGYVTAVSVLGLLGALQAAAWGAAPVCLH
jgi:hypothetical protein